MNLTQLLIYSLVAWRTGHLITNDILFEQPKEWLLSKLPNNKTTTYFTILIYCIYCITFWTAHITYHLWPWATNILAIWAGATLIGVTHNHYSKEPTEENTDPTELE